LATSRKNAGNSKVAVITGGSRGIGLAMARAFVSAGYKVIITGRDQRRLQAAAGQFDENNAQIEIQVCDVADPTSVETALTEIERHHKTIDVLVNNAGIAHPLASIEKLDPETWKQVIETNLTGMFLVTRAALPLMKSGGTIVNNLSVAAIQSFSGMAAYNASKAGAMGFTNVLREELRERGIRVLALLPGATDTGIWGQFWPNAPREKMVSPDTVAQAVLLAVSAPASTAIEEIRLGPAAGAL
jgi:NAD(P)-dependent dehydrogenase (short-subunit alcohol dehydrogenase family)